MEVKDNTRKPRQSESTRYTLWRQGGGFVKYHIFQRSSVGAGGRAGRLARSVDMRPLGLQLQRKTCSFQF